MFTRFTWLFVLAVGCGPPFARATEPVLFSPPSPSGSATGDALPAAAHGQLPWSLVAASDNGAGSSDEESAGQSSLADRLKALEEKYEELLDSQDELESSLEQYVQTRHDGSTMRFGGRIHFDLWGFPGDSPGVNGFESGDNNVSPQDQVGFRRLRLELSGDVGQNMLYKFDLELAEGEDSSFRDAYLGFTDLPWLQDVYIGNQKRPYGLDHINSSRNNVFMERPFVVEAFNEDNRRLGIQSWGVSEDQAWNWRYGVFNQRVVQDEGKFISDHWQSQIAGRLANTLWWDEASDGRSYLHWAIAGTRANTDQNADTENFAGSGISEARFRTRPEARSVSRWLDTGVIEGSDYYSLLGLEGVVNVGAVQVVGEYQSIWLDRVAGSDLRFHGGYVYVSYFLTGEHMPWDRETGQLGRAVPFENFFLVDTFHGRRGWGIGAWQVAARYSRLDLSDDDIQGGIGESFTFGVNWLWNPWARTQFNYIYGNIHDNSLNAAGGVDFGDYHIVGTRFMIDF